MGETDGLGLGLGVLDGLGVGVALGLGEPLGLGVGLGLALSAMAIPAMPSWPIKNIPITKAEIFRWYFIGNCLSPWV